MCNTAAGTHAIGMMLLLLLAGEAYCASFYSNLARPLCPGEVAVYTCDVPPYSLATTWTVSPSPCNGRSVELTLDPAKCAGISETCGGFVIQNKMVISGVCSTSTLTVTANEIMNGVRVQCLAKGQFASLLIGENYLKLVDRPSVTVRVFESTDNILVGLNVSSDAAMFATVKLLDTNNNLISAFVFNSTYENVTFHELLSDTRYFVTVTTSNCAGNTKVTHSAHTLARPPIITNTAFVIGKSKAATRYLEVEWVRDRGSNVSEYEITIKDDFGFGETEIVYCKNEKCSYMQELITHGIHYGIYLSSVNGEGIRGPQTFTNATNTTNAVIQDIEVDFFSDHQATFGCSFNQSFYCMVCCSTDPSVPPDSSVYNISTTKGTEVTVSLQGLTSGQMYYCKAAATNTNSNKCAGPVVGGVKFHSSFMTTHQSAEAKVLSVSDAVKYKASSVSFAVTAFLVFFIST